MARVIVVDDDESVARLVGDVVRFCGHESLVMTDSLVVARAVHDPTIAAVLADYMMPRIDGLELLAIWQDARPMVRRVLITAAPGEPAVKEALHSGLAQMVVAKPPTIADIKMALSWL